MKLRIFHDGGARREAFLEGFHCGNRVFVRSGPLYEFSLVHGFGLGPVKRWHLHSDDLNRLRQMARAKGLKFQEGPRPTPRNKITRTTSPNPNQKDLFE